jgi:hypothetical protein
VWHGVAVVSKGHTVALALDDTTAQHPKYTGCNVHQKHAVYRATTDAQV